MDLVTLRAYFENLAKQHTLVQHSAQQKRFIRTNPFEIETSIQSTMNFPLVTMEDPYVVTDAEWANVQDRWRGGIMVFDKVGDRGDFAKQEEAKDKCRKIAQDFKLRIINDLKRAKYQDEETWMNMVKLEGFTIEIMTEPIQQVLYGVRLGYEFTVWAGVHVPENWVNEEEHYHNERAE